MLIACSAACAFTYFLALSSLEAVDLPLKESKEGVLVLFQGSSKVPQTGVISLKVAEELRKLRGVEAVSPEVLAPVEVNGCVAFLRGINPVEFSTVEGFCVALPYENSVLVGSRLAKLLNLSYGDVLVVKGLIVNRTISLKVTGILESEGPLSDELITHLRLGQELRGISKNGVTFIRAKVDPSSLDVEGLKDLLGEPRKASLLERLTSLLYPGSIKPSRAASYLGPPESLVEREVSASKTLIWALILVVIFSSALAVYNSVGWVLEEVKSTLSLLIALGLTQARKKCWLASIFTLISSLSGLVGYLTGYVLFKTLSESGQLRLMFHTLTPTLGIDALLTSIVAVTSLTLASLIVSLQLRRGV